MYKNSKKPCKKCGTYQRYVSNNHCVLCLKEKQRINGNKYAKKYRDNHTEELREKSRNEYSKFGKKFIYLMWSRAKKRAEEKNLPFNLELSDINIPDLCPVLGVEFSVNKTGKGPGDYSPSLDRINCKTGYTKDNVRVICFKANRIKSDAELHEVEKVLEYMKSTQP